MDGNVTEDKPKAPDSSFHFTQQFCLHSGPLAPEGLNCCEFLEHRAKCSAIALATVQEWRLFGTLSVLVLTSFWGCGAGRGVMRRGGGGGGEGGRIDNHRNYGKSYNIGEIDEK